MSTDFFRLPQRHKPGLFFTSIGFGTGKTVAACAIADNLVNRGLKVGVCQPFATNCRLERGSLVSDDAQALAHFAQLDPDVGGLPLVCPVPRRPSHAPAVAMERASEPFDPSMIQRSFEVLDAQCDLIVVEGVGGVMTPLDPDRPELTTLDLARELGYPVVVVTEAETDALSQTALTVNALRREGCRVAGLVVNRYLHDNPDPAMQANRDWLQKMNRVPLVATVPLIDTKAVPQLDVSAGYLHDDVRIAMLPCDWPALAKRPPQRKS